MDKLFKKLHFSINSFIRKSGLLVVPFSFMSFENYARQFAEIYYNLYNDIDQRRNLAEIYTPNSLLTLNNKQIVGNNDIMEELMNLKNHRKLHQHVTAQPSLNDTILLTVQGQTGFLDDNGQVETPLEFFEIFLIGQENGQFFIINQIFSTIGF